MSDLGTLSSLGLGSSGALSYDTIDKLREADEDAIIKPIDNKIELTQNRQKALDDLTTLLASFKSAASSLSYDSLYSKVNVDTTGSSAIITAQDGVNTQDINLDISNIATNDVKESDSFSSTDSTFTNSSDTLKFELAGGESFSIDVDENTTISKLAEEINNNSNGTMTASILNVGGDKPYKLIIKSTETGADNAITISSTGGGTAADDLNMTTVGNGAQDAHFTYNGVAVTRSSNDISDLIIGVDIKLTDSGITNATITQDTQSIKDEINSLITGYNDLIDSLNSGTKYDPNANEVGIFQGVSQIRGIKNEINDDLFNFSYNGQTMADFGITLNSAGHLELDEATLDSKLQNDPNGVKDFFMGETQTNPQKGLFANLNDDLGSIFMDRDSELKLYKSYLDENLRNLNDRKDSQTKKLDIKYEIMAKKFASYDSIISNFNASYQSLQMQIDSFTNPKK
ncbi:MAG: flagellar filament capping protein FliD [Epsilonproteobacteria bacterium]|nr:flagellar filament capping protein FliD [Campylobacterota bacterium]